MVNLQPEAIAQNRFQYNKIMKSSELTLVNRRIKKRNDKGPLSGSRDSLADLQKFFVMSSDDSDESKLNYFLINKWIGYDAKKKKTRSPVIINLSVDYYYSIYLEKKQKKGNSIMERKARFPAEKATVFESRNGERAIEISYPEKGLFWTSKKKIRIGLAANEVEEFMLHHQQALSIFSQAKALSQSAIVSKTAYSDAGATQRPISNLNTRDPRLVESHIVHSDKNLKIEFQMANFEKQFTSERVIQNIELLPEDLIVRNQAPQVSPNRFKKKNKGNGNQVQIEDMHGEGPGIQGKRVHSEDDSGLGSEYDSEDEAYLSDSSVKKMNFANDRTEEQKEGQVQDQIEGQAEDQNEEQSQDSSQRLPTEEEVREI